MIRSGTFKLGQRLSASLFLLQFLDLIFRKHLRLGSLFEFRAGRDSNNVAGYRFSRGVEVCPTLSEEINSIQNAMSSRGDFQPLPLDP